MRVRFACPVCGSIWHADQLRQHHQRIRLSAATPKQHRIFQSQLLPPHRHLNRLHLPPHSGPVYYILYCRFYPQFCAGQPDCLQPHLHQLQDKRSFYL